MWGLLYGQETEKTLLISKCIWTQIHPASFLFFLFQILSFYMYHSLYEIDTCLCSTPSFSFFFSTQCVVKSPFCPSVEEICISETDLKEKDTIVIKILDIIKYFGLNIFILKIRLFNSVFCGTSY